MSERAISAQASDRTQLDSTRSDTMEHTHAHPSQPSRFNRGALAAGWHFTRHLLEMLAAMFVGMVALGLAVMVLGTPPGDDTLFGGYAYMAAAMTLPMVAWMRRMGHPWADCREMAAAMLVPMFALVVPVALGWGRFVPGLDAGSLMPLAHGAMIGGMVLLMVYRRDRYAHGAHHHDMPADPATATQADDLPAR